MKIHDLIEQVGLFNEIAGNFDNVDDAKLLSQVKVVREEAIELYQAVEEGFPEEEILKECVDCLVTISGFYKMLEQQGYDVLGAWGAVNSNNLSKFPTTYEAALQSQEALHEAGTEVTIEEDEFYKVFVLKDRNHKVRKPINYQKVDVSKYCPQEVA